MPAKGKVKAKDGQGDFQSIVDERGGRDHALGAAVYLLQWALVHREDTAHEGEGSHVGNTEYD